MGAPTSELPATMPARRAELARVAIDGETVVFDPVDRRCHRLNLTAALVLDGCDGTTPTEEVCAALGERFGTDRLRIAGDIAAVLADFTERRLVISGPGAGGGASRPSASRSSADLRFAEPPSPLAAVPDEPVQPRRFATGPLTTLGVTALLTTDDEPLDRVARDRLGSLSGSPATGAPNVTYELVPAARGTDVRADGRLIGNARTPDAALSLVQWHLNRVVAEACGSRLQLHASAARLGGAEVAVFPGDADAGKSTLVAGLVRAGHGYLTDELVTVELGSGRAEGYRKAINLDPGSWRLFPDVVPDDAGDQGEEHVVDPVALHPGALADPATGEIALLAFPEFLAGGPTRATRLARTAALVALAGQCTNLADHGQAGLETLAVVVADAPAYRLEMGALDEAVRTVERIAAELGP